MMVLELRRRDWKERVRIKIIIKNIPLFLGFHPAEEG